VILWVIAIGAAELAVMLTVLFPAGVPETGGGVLLLLPPPQLVIQNVETANNAINHLLEP